jgi:putative tricarboxylic transport membrane protein
VSSSSSHRDLRFGCVMLAISAGYYWMATLIPTSQLADAVGPRGLPTMYAALLALLSIILIVGSLLRRRGALPADDSSSRDVQGRTGWRVAGMLGIGVIYIAAAPWLGYLLSIAALILATTYYQGGALNRYVALVAISGAVFFWLLFVVLMRIPQPPGWWPSLL